MSGKTRTLTIQETVTVTEEFAIEPCLDCGSYDVLDFDCGYSSFNVTGVKCRKCNRSIEIRGYSTKKERLTEWNRWNGKFISDVRRVELLREQIAQLGKKPLV